VLDEDGIEVATEDRAAWDAAVASFEQARRAARLALLKTSSNVAGIQAEPVTVLGASECGLNGSGAILT
jgi:hypothetical protein